MLQMLTRMFYPPLCISCGMQVEGEFALCMSCWAKTPFISGLVCDQCGQPLPGEGDDAAVPCDDCLAHPPPWDRGRAALLYSDNARRLVMALKHGDRDDIALPAGFWMAQAARSLVTHDTLVVPVPLHWSRLLRRKYNQAALLAQSLARALDLPCCPDLLLRTERTPALEQADRAERFVAISGKISLNPRWAGAVAQRRILLVDDVMTSGATLSACTLACQQGGAENVCVIALARVTRQSYM